MNTKRQDFLMIVQTVFIAHIINIRPDDIEGKNRHEYSSTAAFMYMDDALTASDKIPENMTASEAANEFTEFMLIRSKKREKCPRWFSR